MEVRTNKIGDIRSHYRRKLAEIFTEREADILVFHLLTEYTGMTKAQLLSFPENTLSESELLKIHFGVKELLKHKPVQYVIGKSEFYGLNFKVNSKVLIPRPETEELVEKTLSHIPENENLKVLDIGTGSGCIAVAIKNYRPYAEVIAVDFSAFALEVAAENARINHVNIEFLKVDLLSEKDTMRLGQFDIVVSNPPYVRESEKSQMDKNVLEYEPASALFVDDEDPLIFYKSIAVFSKNHLNPGGKILVEINQYLPDETQNVFINEGFNNVILAKDHFDRPRVITVLT